MNARRAFTLIELLVVIAIIAILAAILFPVFAQAKVAAKGAASISNDKQTTTAAMTYMTDYDDFPVLHGQGDLDAPLNLGQTGPYKPWGYLLRPYSKNGEILQDPLTSHEINDLANQGVSNDLIWCYRTQFGYAFSIHSPDNQVNGVWRPTPTSQTALAKPAETVFFVLKKGRVGNPDWYWVGSFLWGANLVNPPVLSSNQTTTGAGVEPVSWVVPKECWGIGCKSYDAQTEDEGALTGGVAFRKSGKSIVSMSDGHVKAMSMAQLAAGTNFTKTSQGYNVKLTDVEQYIWDKN